MFKTLLEARKLIAELSAKAGVVAPKVKTLQEARLKVEALKAATLKTHEVTAKATSAVQHIKAELPSFNDNGAGRASQPEKISTAKVSQPTDWRSEVQATDDYGQKLRIIQNAQAAKRAEIESLPPNQRWGQYESLKQLTHAEAYVRQARDTVSSAKERAARKILDNQGL